MRADGKNTFIEKGDTNDIIENVLTTFEEYWQQCRDFAKQFYDPILHYTCKNIFDYCIKNIRYKEDPDGKQYIKTPARLIEDRVGDCKSFAILIASILRCLNIDAFFRFVRFEGNNNFTHVYIITADRGIIIDPVERIKYVDRKIVFTDIHSGQPKFNIARPFAEKVDYMNETNIYRLSGIEANTADEVYLRSQSEIELPDVLASIDVWTDGRPFYEQTEAENELNSFVDLAMSEYSVTKDRNYLDNIDRLLVTKFLLQQPDKITASKVLQKMEDENFFGSNIDTTDEGRADNLDYLRSVAHGFYLHPAEAKLPLAGGAMNYFADLVKRHVKPNSDFVFRYRAAIENFKTVSLGMTVQEAQNQLVLKIKQSGMGFLYCFVSEELYNELHARNPIISKKRMEEWNAMYEWATDLQGTGLSYQSIYNYIQSGCVLTVNMPIEEYVHKALDKGEFPDAIMPTVGNPLVAVILVVIQILIAIFELIKAIKDAFSSNPANYPTMVADNSDLEKALNGGNTTTTTTTGTGENILNSGVSPLILIAGGIALLSIFKSKKGGTDGSSTN